MSSVPRSTSLPWNQMQRAALVAGVVGLILCSFSLFFGAARFFRAYLVAYHFWLGIALGSMTILMLHYITGGNWGLVLKRVLEAGVRTIPILAALFLPLILGMRFLFSWTHETEHHKAIYLNTPFFLIRAAAYFVVWIALGYLLHRWTRSAEQAGDVRRVRRLSAGGLVLYGLTVTFASIDWAMSLEPDWYSTIYPVIFAVGQILSGLAFSVALLMAFALFGNGRVATEHQRDLGNLLLAFVMVWAYVTISQFLLIWIGNLPEENIWYLRRTQGGWQWLAGVLAVMHFALPFLLLLPRDLKSDARWLGAIAALILVMRFLDVLWWIEPAFGDRFLWFWLADVAALIGIGGVWAWWFLRQLQRCPIGVPELRSSEVEMS